jgi:hypothetical protein
LSAAEKAMNSAATKNYMIDLSYNHGCIALLIVPNGDFGVTLQGNESLLPTELSLKKDE